MLDAVAKRYELTGAAIMNVVRYAALMALERGDQTLREQDLMTGIQREYYKEGRGM